MRNIFYQYWIIRRKNEPTKEVIEIDQKLANSMGSLNKVEKLTEER